MKKYAGFGFLLALVLVLAGGRETLAKEKEEELLTRFAPSFLKQAKEFDQMLSVLPEAMIAREHAVAAMHDVTEGGIFGALWEMAEASGVGLEIDLKKIPVRQETIELCEFFDVNPYELISSGCMLMAGDRGHDLVRELEKAKIPAAVIGKAVEGKARRILNGEEEAYLERPRTDELYRIL